MLQIGHGGWWLGGLGGVGLGKKRMWVVGWCNVDKLAMPSARLADCRPIQADAYYTLQISQMEFEKEGKRRTAGKLVMGAVSEVNVREADNAWQVLVSCQKWSCHSKPHKSSHTNTLPSSLIPRPLTLLGVS